MAFFRRAWLTMFLLGAALLLVYIGTRMTNLTKLPIFTDEAIYVRWSQIGSRDANWRFISLTDGKQPMFTWIMMGMLRIIDDPLLAGRLVSVLAGSMSLVGIWFLAYEIFQSKRIGFFASLLYLISPFSLIYDRMALYDSLVASFSIWNLYLAIQLVRSPRLDIALLLGMTLGGGMLNKTSGFLSLYLLPITLLLFSWGEKGRVKRLCRWVLYVGIAAVLSQILYSILRLSPFFHMVAQKDSVFVYPFREWIQHPFSFAQGNLRGLFDWLIHYLTIPLFFASVFALFSSWEKLKEKLLLYMWWGAPFVGLALFGRVLYPRFIFFMTMPLLVLAAWTVDWVIKRWGKTLFGLVLVSFLLLPSIYADYFIIMNPLYAPIPQADKGQYVNDWPAGWGVREVNAFLFERSQNNRVSVYTEGTFGLLPYALEIYLVDKPNIQIHGIWPLPKSIPESIVDDVRSNETYLVLNETQEQPTWPLLPVAEYSKGLRSDRKLRLYRILPPVAPQL